MCHDEHIRYGGCSWHLGLAPTRFWRAAGTCLSHRARTDPGSSCHLEGSAIERSLERSFQGKSAFSVSLLITQHWCCSASGLGCGFLSPLVSCKLKQMWNTGMRLLSSQPKPCQQMILSRFQSQLSLPSSDDFTLTRFTPTDLASVHWCVREENVAPCLLNQNHQRQNRRSLRFLLPVLPCSLSPDIPSIAQLPVCEKYLVEIWNSLKMYCVECNKMMIFLYKYLGFFFLC